MMYDQSSNLKKRLLFEPKFKIGRNKKKENAAKTKDKSDYIILKNGMIQKFENKLHFIDSYHHSQNQEIHSNKISLNKFNSRKITNSEYLINGINTRYDYQKDNWAGNITKIKNLKHKKESNNLSKHISTVDPDSVSLRRIIYHCKFCIKNPFNTYFEEEIDDHYLKIHSGKILFSNNFCKNCNIQFLYDIDLVNHSCNGEKLIKDPSNNEKYKNDFDQQNLKKFLKKNLNDRKIDKTEKLKDGYREFFKSTPSSIQYLPIKENSEAPSDMQLYQSKLSNCTKYEYTEYDLKQKDKNKESVQTSLRTINNDKEQIFQDVCKFLVKNIPFIISKGEKENENNTENNMFTSNEERHIMHLTNYSMSLQKNKLNLKKCVSRIRILKYLALVNRNPNIINCGEQCNFVIKKLFPDVLIHFSLNNYVIYENITFRKCVMNYLKINYNLTVEEFKQLDEWLDRPHNEINKYSKERKNEEIDEYQIMSEDISNRSSSTEFTKSSLEDKAFLMNQSDCISNSEY